MSLGLAFRSIAHTASGLPRPNPNPRTTQQFTSPRQPAPNPNPTARTDPHAPAPSPTSTPRPNSLRAHPADSVRSGISQNGTAQRTFGDARKGALRQAGAPLTSGIAKSFRMIFFWKTRSFSRGRDRIEIESEARFGGGSPVGRGGQSVRLAAAVPPAIYAQNCAKVVQSSLLFSICCATCAQIYFWER